MAPRLPIPRITLKRRPSSRNDSPGLSSVPASIDPIITLSAPAASAFTTSPEYLMPTSAITGTSPAPAPPPPPPPPPPPSQGQRRPPAAPCPRAWCGARPPHHPPVPQPP